MTCKAWRDRLTEYMEDALPADKTAALEAHLSACPDCARQLAVLRATVGALRALPLVEPPPRTLEMISAALDDVDNTATVRRRWWSWQQVSALAVAACLMIGFVSILRHGVQPEATLVPAPAQPAAERSADRAKSATPAVAVAPSEPGPGDALANAPAGPGGAPGGPMPGTGGMYGMPGVPGMGGMPPGGPPPVFGGPRRSFSGGPRRNTRRDSPRVAEATSAKPAASEPPQNSATAPTGDASSPAGPRRSRDDATPAASADAAPPARATRESPRPFTLDGVGPTTGARGDVAEEPPAPAPAMPASVPREAAGLRSAFAPGAPPAAGGTPGLTYAAEPATTSTVAKSAGVVGDEDAAGVGVALSFMPPATRQVGIAGTGAITITPDVDVAEATVRVKAARGLTITNADEAGVLYQGRLPGQRRTTLAVNLLASEPGTQALCVEVLSPEPAANASVGVKVPGFEKSEAPDTDRRSEPAAPDISLEFHETPLRDALLAVGRTAGVRVEVAPDVSGPRVNARFQRVPADAALRILCEEGQYSLKGAPGGYAVTGP